MSTERGASSSRWTLSGLALAPPPATAIPALQERTRGGIGRACGVGDAFPANSGPATVVSYGVYPQFHDPYRLAPYGNVRFSATGYPPVAEYAAWRAPRVGSWNPALDGGGGWPRSVPAGASAAFQLTYPAVAYRAL
jgi:hypothetical protein